MGNVATVRFVPAVFGRWEFVCRLCLVGGRLLWRTAHLPTPTSTSVRLYFTLCDAYVFQVHDQFCKEQEEAYSLRSMSDDQWSYVKTAVGPGQEPVNVAGSVVSPRRQSDGDGGRQTASMIAPVVTFKAS